MIRWTATTVGATGYADSARALVTTLRWAGHDVEVDEVGIDFTSSAQGDHLRVETRLDAPPPLLHVVHHPWPEFPPSGTSWPLVWRMTFETDRVPDFVVEQTRRVRAVWVPSTFNRDVFVASGIDPSRLTVVPEPVDTRRFRPPSRPRRSAGDFTFLSVFRWQRRKGWDVLLRAFLSEFTDRDRVRLLLKIDPFDHGDMFKPRREIAELVRTEFGGRTRNLPRLEMIDETVGDDDLVGLYHSSSAFVLPSRGEGWGRTLMEAMATGLPTIATRWSGNLDYMNDGNSFLVDYRLCEVDSAAAVEWPLFRGHRWAEPNVTDLARRLRQVFEDRRSAMEVGEMAADDIGGTLSFTCVADVLSAEILALSSDDDRPLGQGGGGGRNSDVPSSSDT